MVSSQSVARRVALLQGQPAGHLLIHELYRSIQGESTFAGLPCVFVRLAVCDARCTWCDTPHAFGQGRWIDVEDVVAEVLRFDCPLVEVTGGEPLLQPDVLPLMTRMADAGCTVLLETSGAHDIGRVDRRVHVIMDLKCPDSGECENNCWPNLDRLKLTDQVKFVIASRSDFEWAANVVRSGELDKRVTVLFSPVFGLVAPVDLSNWLLASQLHVRMQLQMHKFIWDPKARGV
jgi:7-carboxy-7-deazaguanine synthase